MFLAVLQQAEVPHAEILYDWKYKLKLTTVLTRVKSHPIYLEFEIFLKLGVGLYSILS